MYIPPSPRLLDVRQDAPKDPPPDQSAGDGSHSGNQSNKNYIFIICAACIVFVLALLLMMFFVLRSLRRMNCRPKYIPGKRLKDKWNHWNVGGASYGQVSGRTSSPRNPADGSRSAEASSEMNTANNGTVRRDASVRSTITLPPYSFSPKPEEQVIAREGERGGMDVVLEFPETAEEEEARREELMESLYQIRQQRRQEQAEREARRQERREARNRGDFIRLEELRVASRARARSRSSTQGTSNSNSNSNSNPNLTQLEHRSRGRDRRISSVSYAEIGRVRHDGSRLRAGSGDSDRRPLLNSDSAPDRSSGSHLTNIHSRGESNSSIATGGGGSDTDSLTPVQSHSASMQSTDATTPATEEGASGDVGNLSIPPPPEYEHLDWGEAPPYESPVSARGEGPPRLRELTPLPTIHVDVASPVSNGPTTPAPADPDPDPAPSQSQSQAQREEQDSTASVRHGHSAPGSDARPSGS